MLRGREARQGTWHATELGEVAPLLLLPIGLAHVFETFPHAFPLLDWTHAQSHCTITLHEAEMALVQPGIHVGAEQLG